MKHVAKVIVGAWLLTLNILAHGQEVTDTITIDRLMKLEFNETYQDFKGIKIASHAVYAGNVGFSDFQDENISCIKLRKLHKCEGIITTKSGGKIKSVTFEFYHEKARAERTIVVYGKDDPYIYKKDKAAAELHNTTKSKCGTVIGKLSGRQCMGTKTINISQPFQYIGIASTGKLVAYIKAIHVKWEPQEVELPKVVIDEDNIKNNLTERNTDILLKRSFSSAWNSLVLPCDLSMEKIRNTFGKDTRIALYSGSRQNADGTFTLIFKSSNHGTRANEPFFILGPEKREEYLIENVSIVTGEATTRKFGFDFVGSYGTTTLKAGDYFISSDNNFYRANGNERMKATRAIFRPNQGIRPKQLILSIDNVPTKIILPSLTPSGKRYGIDGKKIARGHKGIIIEDGKKYIVK